MAKHSSLKRAAVDGGDSPGSKRPKTLYSVADLDAKHPSQKPYPHIPTENYSTYPRTELETSSSSYPPPLPQLRGDLAEAPFIHSSISNENTLNYEQFEFLGDAYLEVIATRLIFSRFSALTVGRQSALREKLVRNSTLARYARLYDFGSRLRMANPGHASEKGQEKVLGDLVEAYLGAVITSDGEGSDEDGKGGFQLAEEWMIALWVPLILEEDPTIEIVVNRKDELARVIGGKFIKIDYVGKAFNEKNGLQSSTVAIYLTGWGYEREKLAVGTGISKKDASYRAAVEVLDNGGKRLERIKEIKKKHDDERKAAAAAANPTINEGK